MQGKDILFFSLFTIILLVLPGTGGCRSEQVPGAAGPGKDLSAFYQALFREAGISRWQGEEEPDVGVGLEGLYRLVNGAAESYWERGVTQAAFQEFSVGGGLEVLEIHWFSFRSSRVAERFFEQTCREDRGTQTEAGSVACCRFAGGPLNRALVRKDTGVYDLQLYGIPASDDDPVTRLVEAFGCLREHPDSAH